jgi:hypothetical protein
MRISLGMFPRLFGEVELNPVDIFEEAPHLACFQGSHLG